MILGLAAAALLPKIIEQGVSYGIVLKEQRGFLITNCCLHTRQVTVKLDPHVVCRKHVPATSSQTSGSGQKWKCTVIEHTQMDMTHMLLQLQKFTITQSELCGPNRRSKCFIGGLLTAASLVRSLFGLGLSAYNSVNVAAIQ